MTARSSFQLIGQAVGNRITKPASSATHSAPCHVLMTNRYDVELVRKGEVWVIGHLTVDNAWTEGDPSVLGGI